MSLMTEYPPGTFNWTELSTTDTAGATEFYAGLFGWSFEEMPMPGERNSYHAARNGEHLVAGVFHREDLPKIPFWHSYVAVASADECAEKAAGLGGSVLVEPFDVGEAGRMAVVQDPTGGVFQPWQAGLQTGAGIANEPVSLCWNELLTRDPEGAAKFYCDLFGWTAETTHNGLVPYTMLRNSGRAAAGIFTITEEMENVPPALGRLLFRRRRRRRRCQGRGNGRGSAPRARGHTGRRALRPAHRSAGSLLQRHQDPQPGLRRPRAAAAGRHA